MVKLIKISILIALVVLFSVSNAFPNSLKNEIDHLFEFISHSDCIFIRNGVEHTPEEATEHILRKYAYFQKKIATTEDFIELCATKSTITKKYYEVTCDEGSRIRSRDWLLNELKRFRNKRN